MRKLNILLSIVTLSIFFIGCSKDYFDVDKPSNSEDYENLALKDILAPTIVFTFNAQIGAATNTEQFTQHLASAFTANGPDRHYETLADGVWSDLYLQAMTNIKILERKAIDKDAIHYKGIAHVLMAINLGLATDMWGNIPYSQAFQGQNNLYPAYDSQQAIYTEINSLLSNAIAELSATDSGIDQPGTDDLVYQGNIAKWIKAAYTFKARFALHLSKKNGGSTVAPQIISDLALGMAANTDDFQLVYNSRNLNPWYVSQLGLKTGNLSYYIGKYFISNMNGDNFPFSTAGYFDPRMYKLVDIRNYPDNTTGADPDVVANYKGSIGGTGGRYTVTPSVAANARIGIDMFYSKAESPVVILSNSEAQFMKAEAEFLLAGGTTTSIGSSVAANAAYLAGIGFNMDKLGVTATQKAAYLAETSVNVGEGSLMLKHIMREKFTTLFLNYESFNDQRRYGFSTDVFPGLALPLNRPTIFGTNWVQRFRYPSVEANTNPDNYNANIVNTNLHTITPVWLYQ
jgi:hypothetical protein